MFVDKDCVDIDVGLTYGMRMTSAHATAYAERDE